MPVEYFLIVVYIVEILIDALAWGAGGYLVFRLLGMKYKYWYLDFALVVAIYTAYDYISCRYIQELDISIGNQRVMEFFDVDISTFVQFDYLNVVVDIATILFGYLMAKRIHGVLRRRASADATPIGVK